MKLMSKISQNWKNENFVKIRRYIQKPALVSFLLADAVIAILILVLLFIGKLEDWIVSMDIRYNSPAFLVLGISFLVIQVFAVGYGILLSLKKYRRPGGKGISSVSYKQGNSFAALHEFRDTEQKQS